MPQSDGQAKTYYLGRSSRILSDEAVCSFKRRNERHDRHIWAAIEKVLHSRFSPAEPFLFLDLGCGDGYFADRLLESFAAASGILVDSSQLMIELNRPSPRKTIVLGSVLEWPEIIAQRRFDCVLLNMVLHHCVAEGYAGTCRKVGGLLEQVARALAPGGTVVVLEQVLDGWGGSDLPGLIVYRLTSLRRPGWVVRLMRRLGANTAGVGVMFRSAASWRALFKRAGFRVFVEQVMSVDNHPWWRRVPLMLERSYQKCFALERTSTPVSERERSHSEHAHRWGERGVAGLAMCVMLMLSPAVFASNERQPSFNVFVRRAIQDAMLLPTSTTGLGTSSHTIRIWACPGEYEPASFVVRAARPLAGLTVEVQDLEAAPGVIPARQVDLRVVKCWFQAGSDATELDRKHLTPELLLHDDALVRVDVEAGTNSIRHGPPGSMEYRDATTKDGAALHDLAPQDTPELRPVDLSAGVNQQYWLTVHVPDDAAPGRYVGAIWIRSREGVGQRLELDLMVRGFKLPEPRLTYGIYYRGVLDPAGGGSISSELKSERQYMAELADMLSHGVRAITLYQKMPSGLVPRALELRAEAGLPRDRLFTLGYTTGKPTSAHALAELEQKTRAWLALAGAAGYEQLYVYGVDEAGGRELLRERKAWELVRSLGARVFVACGKDALLLMGRLLDIAILPYRPDPVQAAGYHALGKEVYAYGFPQVAPVAPETYRRNYGITLWLAGYDGAMPYAYQHSFGHIWNDFDHQRYRDLAFAYPTVDGVVPTIQWEGFREGVDDVRYLTALEEAISAAGQNGRTDAEEARRWLESLALEADLDRMREEAAQWIERLQGGPADPSRSGSQEERGGR